MALYTHGFVETYEGPVCFGFDRETDESSLICYLQMFSDDALMAAMRKRLSDEELARLFDLLSDLLRRHLNEAEYHALFLKESPDEKSCPPAR